MEIKILKQEKNELEISVDNITVAEILREYLNKNEIDFVAWRREHPTKPAILRIQSSGKTTKKEISEAVALIEKDLDKILTLVKK